MVAEQFQGEQTVGVMRQVLRHVTRRAPVGIRVGHAPVREPGGYASPYTVGRRRSAGVRRRSAQIGNRTPKPPTIRPGPPQEKTTAYGRVYGRLTSGLRPRPLKINRLAGEFSSAGRGEVGLVGLLGGGRRGLAQIRFARRGAGPIDVPGAIDGDKENRSL